MMKRDLIDDIKKHFAAHLSQEHVAYHYGEIIGWFPISKLGRLLRLAAKLEKL